MMYAIERNLGDDLNFIWQWPHSQAVDMLQAGISNIIRVLTKAPIITIQNTYSEANEYASSTINIWANSLVYAGIPWFVVVVLLLPLCGLTFISLRNILQIARQQNYLEEKLAILTR